MTNIIYGGKITDQQDIDTVDLHIQESMRSVNLDRTYFWQTVWADDKFPKNQQEHEQYLKTNVFNRPATGSKSIFEVFGISSFVTNYVKQKQYRDLSNFYLTTSKYVEKEDTLPAIHKKIKGLR